MNRALLGLVLVGAARAHAATLPDFSGHWTLVVPPAASVPAATTPAPAATAPAPAAPALVAATPPPVPIGDMGSGWGKALTLTQTATELGVEFVYYTKGDLQPPFHFTYALDGTERINHVLTGFGEQDDHTVAVWRDGALELTSTSSFRDPDSGATLPVVVTRTLSLPTPTSLVLTVTRHGVLGAKDVTTTTTWQRVE